MKHKRINKNNVKGYDERLSEGEQYITLDAFNSAVACRTKIIKRRRRRIAIRRLLKKRILNLAGSNGVPTGPLPTPTSAQRQKHKNPRLKLYRHNEE